VQGSNAAPARNQGEAAAPSSCWKHAFGMTRPHAEVIWVGLGKTGEVVRVWRGLSALIGGQDCPRARRRWWLGMGDYILRLLLTALGYASQLTRLHQLIL
jgi:hypothetical protein